MARLVAPTQTLSRPSVTRQWAPAVDVIGSFLGARSFAILRYPWEWLFNREELVLTFVIWPRSTGTEFTESQARFALFNYWNTFQDAVKLILWSSRGVAGGDINVRVVEVLGVGEARAERLRNRIVSLTKVGVVIVPDRRGCGFWPFGSLFLTGMVGMGDPICVQGPPGGIDRVEVREFLVRR